MILGPGQIVSAGVGVPVGLDAGPAVCVVAGTVLGESVPLESGKPENPETVTAESTELAVIVAVSATARA